MLKTYFNKKIQFSDPVLNEGSREFEVNNWIISEFIVKNIVPIVGIHPFPLNELMLMTSAVCRFKPKLILEWGTNIGKSARIFYEISKSFNLGCQVHSIDLPDSVFHNEHPHKTRGVFVKGINEVILHQADGLKKSFELIENIKPAGNILFFVDGDHSYETVKGELTSIQNKYPDAIILLHDTFSQSGESGYNTGPIKAIDEYVNKNLYNVISTQLGLPGMSLIYKKGM